MQQSFQNVFVHLQKFQGRSSFSTWLTRIAINEALMYLRKNRVVLRAVSLEEVNLEYASVLPTDRSDARANPEELYIQREKEQILSFVIDRLPPLLQGAVRLYLDDLTVKEVGQCLGVRISTVKARLFRGRQKASPLFKHYVDSAQRSESTKSRYRVTARSDKLMWYPVEVPHAFDHETVNFAFASRKSKRETDRFENSLLKVLDRLKRLVENSPVDYTFR